MKDKETSHAAKTTYVPMTINRFSKIILTLLLIMSGLALFHRAILTSAGTFMAPKSEESAEVLILEGSQTVKTSALKAGARLLTDGKAKRIIVVLHAPLKEGQAFALPREYPKFVVDELYRLGLKKNVIEVLPVPIAGHPITLSEAQYVAAHLSRDKVRSALLVSEGFHTRRSFGVYKKEGERMGVHMVPYSYFTEYNSDSWWRDTQGINDLFGESLKLCYYLICGYLSMGNLI